MTFYPEHGMVIDDVLDEMTEEDWEGLNTWDESYPCTHPEPELMDCY